MKRLDQALVERGLCDSREKARRAVLAGRVMLNEQRARKASDAVREGDRLTLADQDRYVSRGGHKLEHALRHFHIEVHGLTVVDLGASTGGFTDCLLQHGARHVFAVDVGQGQLAWKLRQDPRVTVVEKTNARYLKPEQLPGWPGPTTLVVIDCSFISLRMLLPAAAALLAPGGRVLALVKPQFEAGKAEADRGEGVITDPRIHARVLDDLTVFACDVLHLVWRGVDESPLRGPAGNTEFLALLEKPA